jgi:hypothetical protein
MAIYSYNYIFLNFFTYIVFRLALRAVAHFPCNCQLSSLRRHKELTALPLSRGISLKQGTIL